MLAHITEVVPGITILAGTQTLSADVSICTLYTRKKIDLVILHFPSMRIWRVFNPLFVLRDGKEIDPLLALRDANDGRDKLY